MSYRILDMARDPRHAHFDYFRQMANPYVSVTAECDITNLREHTKTHGLPFFLSLLHCAVNAANAVPELRRRILGDAVVEYDSCDSSHTVALPDGTYCYCRLDCRKPFSEFLPAAQAAVNCAKSTPELDDGSDGNSLFFVTTLPWLHFTSISLPTPVPADSNPRITFGKYFDRHGKVLLPVNLTAHHALVDGRHMAQFFEGIEQRAAQWGSSSAHADRLERSI